MLINNLIKRTNENFVFKIFLKKQFKFKFVQYTLIERDSDK